MKINNQNKLNTIISLLDTHIINELEKNEMNEDRVESLTGIRSEFIQELNNVNRGKNTRDMFDKNYWKSYRKTKIY